jgi:Cof subfamily protein (haloacid dehalogenase superfamily)
MDFRALCTDIDGTLLSSKKDLSPRTIAAFKKIPKDIPVILASSRMPSAMFHLQKELGKVGHPLVCFNGGYILISFGGSTKVIGSVYIPPVVCQDILDLAKGSDIHVSLFWEDEWHAPRYDQWTEREIKNTRVTPTISVPEEVVRLWGINGNGGHKVMCMGPEDQILDMANYLDDSYAEVLHVYRSKSTYLEIAPKQISKATAIKMVLEEHFEIDLGDVIAFGDNYNDIEMIKSVGHGIAVGNAIGQLKSVANEITLDNIEDGVAISIEKYF